MTIQLGILAVIPCLNEEKYIEGLVRSLLRNNLMPGFRIVIADGGSVDNTPAIARQLAELHPNVFFLHNPGRLQSTALNLAVREFGDGAEVLIRLDAHADYPGNYIASLVEEQARTGAASVVVSMNTVGDGLFQRAVAAAQNSKLGNGGAAHRNLADGMWVDHGHHALMVVGAFRAVGGYDESFSHNEDAELDLRLAKAGYRIWLTGRTSLDYHPRSNAVALARQYIRFGLGRARTIRKHGSAPKFRQVAPAAVAPALFLAAFSPMLPGMAVPAMMWAVACLAAGTAMAFMKRDIRLVLVGPAAMIMHSAWSLGFWLGVTFRPAPQSTTMR